MAAASAQADKNGKEEDEATPAGKFSGLAGKLGTLNLSMLESASTEQNLQVLDLKDNKITAVPAEVFISFSQVKMLDLRKNAIEELVPEIGQMRALEDLLLDQNRLREVPSEVCSLPLLKTFSLSQNVLRGLPQNIGDMKALSSLSVGDNQICELPVSLGSCLDLQCLYIHHNHFTKLPSSMCKLEKLSELALEWFRYTTPPLPRVIKGSEWKMIITKFLDLCTEKTKAGESTISCIEVLSLFSQKTFDPNAIDSKRRTRLHVSCLEGHVGVAMALAKNGSKCDSLDCEGYSPLLVAVREEHPDIATALVQTGVDVNKGGGLFGSPLHVATVNFDPHMVLLLIKGKADVNQTDADGNTPLHVLMSVFDKGGKKGATIGQILLKHNADCNLMNSDKWAPMHLAARRGQLRGICFVLSCIDAADKECLNGTCSHTTVTKKPKNSRVKTCPRVFDLDLKGGSHLWTPLHLAGHACHIPVVQVLIEAGADVFLRNIDGRTARHVSRGNLAISKLLRKAEDEWLWYRIGQGDAEKDSVSKKAIKFGAKCDPRPGDANSLTLVDDELEDDSQNAIEGTAKNMEGILESIDPSDKREQDVYRAMHRVIKRCREVNYNQSELQQIQSSNFLTPPANKEEFIAMFTKLTQQGPKNRLLFFISRPWVKDMLPHIISDESQHHLLLQPSLVGNEDFMRMLICNMARDQLSQIGKWVNKEHETILHVLCKSGAGSKTSPTVATRADVLSLLLTACPPMTFDLEAKDMRGQTGLHLAAQSGDIGLIQVLLEHGANPNAQEQTTGWTALHFAVAKAHYALILQLLHHEATNVNQVDKFDWPPILEACSRLDARATSLLVNGGAHLGFKNQHKFDVLKAVDTSKKDLAAKRWMSCLVVSNGFRYEETMVQLTREDRDRLEREKAFYATRARPSDRPPFYIPDHLAPRCHACKVLFSVTVRRYHCRSCGLVLCADCFKWRGSNIVPLDERTCSPSPDTLAGLRDKDLAAAVEQSMAAIKTATTRASAGPSSGDANAGPSASPKPEQKASSQAQRASSKGADAGNAAGGVSATDAPSSDPTPAPASASSDADSFEDPPLGEELPAVGPPMSVICPASMMSGGASGSNSPEALAMRLKRDGAAQGHLIRDRTGRESADSGKMVRLCSCCAIFFETGVGETYGMRQRRPVVSQI